jgi:hypothetical protein
MGGCAFFELISPDCYTGNSLFEERVHGSHHVFVKDGVEELLNLYMDGKSAKPYQVKQVRRVILRYGFGGDD